jgi:predicted nucleic acid-binding protein
VKPVLADTGPLCALVDRDDNLHRCAREEASRIAAEEKSLVVPFPTLLERLRERAVRSNRLTRAFENTVKAIEARNGAARKGAVS